jgi:EpsD family peptidyl-prolyl cis-trans isomerase
MRQLGVNTCAADPVGKRARTYILNHIEIAGAMNNRFGGIGQPWLMISVMTLVLSLAACGNKEAKPGQSLVRVNGEEVTALQLNDELQRLNVPPAQQEAASKQLLESLIDRQLLQAEAAAEKLDRDPKVMQSIERAKAQLIAQAYLQKKIGAPAQPSKSEVEDYFGKHPEFFSARKQFEMRQLMFATKDMDDNLKQ